MIDPAWTDFVAEHPILEQLADERLFHAELRSVLRQRRLPVRLPADDRLEEIRWVALETFLDGARGPKKVDERQLLWRSLGRACYQMIERERLIQAKMKRLPAREATGEDSDPALLIEDREIRERLRDLDFESRAVLAALMGPGVRRSNGRPSLTRVARRSGVDRRRIPRIMSRLLRRIGGVDRLNRCQDLLDRNGATVVGVLIARSLDPRGHRSGVRPSLQKALAGADPAEGFCRLFDQPPSIQRMLNLRRDTRQCPMVTGLAAAAVAGRWIHARSEGTEFSRPEAPP